MSFKNVDLAHEEVFEFLDRLKRAGWTNMFLVPDQIVIKFSVTLKEARIWVSEWMKLNDNGTK